MKHLLSIETLSREEIEAILERAASFAEVGRRDIKKVPTLRGRTVVNLFFEASTRDRKSTRLNSSHGYISYAVFCLKKKSHPLAADDIPIATQLARALVPMVHQDPVRHAIPPGVNLESVAVCKPAAETNSASAQDRC